MTANESRPTGESGGIATQSNGGRTASQDTGHSYAPTGPYAAGARDYWKAGWINVLPIKGKRIPPDGYTGYQGRNVSWPDLQAWLAGQAGQGNIGLRSQGSWIGIDVDAYDGRVGDESLAKAQIELGELPATWTSTSRGAGQPSRIHFYRVPAGTALHGAETRFVKAFGEHVEIIHRTHRFAVVWPSVHPEARTYRWYAPDGATSPTVPALADMAELPPAWLDFLAHTEVSPGPRSAVSVPHSGQDPFGQPSTGTPADTPEAIRRVMQLRDELAGAEAGANNLAASLAFKAGQYVGAGQATGDTVTGIMLSAVDGWAWRQRGDEQAMANTIRRQVQAGAEAPRAWETPAGGGELAEVAAVAEADFWGARPMLADIRDAARARRVGPWAMLGGVLAHVCARIDPRVQLPPIVGSYGSLNLLIGLVGGSGAGKDSALSAAEEYLCLDDNVPVREIGTGQGVTSVYVDAPNGKPPRQICDAAVLTATEIDAVKAHASMQGSTVLSTLRSLWTGAALGAQYADRAKRRPVKAHAYRAAVVMGVQPARAGVLLDDQGGGTPQRMLWLPTNDPRRSEALPAAGDPFGTAVPWRPAAGLAAAGEFADSDMVDGPLTQKPRVVLGVCTEAQAEIVADRERRLALELLEQGGLDDHTLFNRLKVAAVLALLDSRTDVNAEDWRLAGLLLTISAHTRQVCVSALTREKKAVNRSRAHQQAEREEIVADRAVQRVAAALGRKLAAEWTGRKQWRGTLPGRDRDHFDAAVACLVAAGQVETDESGQGVRYRHRK